MSDSIHLFANPALATFMRRSSVDEIKGVRISEIIRPEELQEWHKHFLESKIRNQSVQFEMEMELKGYSHKVCMSTCVSHVGGNQFVYLCQDITTRKELEKQLKKHQEELEKLVKV
jgi:PAS domain-containing protein